MTQRSAYATDTLVYEVVQRVYRNAVVSYARQHLEASLGNALGEAIRRLYQREWADIEKSSDLAHATGATERKPRDELDHLSVNHFRALFEKYWDEIGPAGARANPEFARKIRKHLLTHIDEVIVIRNPISHPPEEPLPLLDAIRCVDAARRALGLLGLSEAASQAAEVLDELLRRAATESATDDEGPTLLEANLPPRESVVVEFVGRSRELAELWGWLVDDTAPRWMLVGDGGKGKSAIAFRFALDVRASGPTPLSIVHWLSAKKRRFDEGEVVAINSPDFWDLESAFDWLLRGYGWPEVTEQDLETKRSAILELLDEFPALVILDDIDTLPSESDDVAEFFMLDVARTRSKVLATSRREYTGMGRSQTVVEGLEEGDARSFLESRLTLIGLTEVNLTEKRTSRIFEATERSPLYMEDLLRLAKFYSIDQAIDVWMANKGDRAREYALSREIELLSSAARTVLETCAVAPTAATVDEIARSTGLGQDAVESAIAELHQMYLVPGPQIVEDVPRYYLNRNLGQMVRKTLREGPRHEEVQNAVQAVFGRVGRSSGHTGVSDVCRQAQVFSRGGEPDRALALLDAALEQHPNTAPLYAMLGKVHATRRPAALVDAHEAFLRAYQLRSKDPGMYQLWTNLHLSNEDWKRAAEAAEAGLAEARADDPRLLQAAGYARSRLARKLRDTFVTDRATSEAIAAEKHLTAAVRHGKGGNVGSEVVGRAYRSWVINADLLGSLDALPRGSPSLCNRLREWLERDPTDEYARREIQFYAQRCPDLRALLTEEGVWS